MGWRVETVTIHVESWLACVLAAGASMFAALFAITWVAPDWVERSAEAFLVSELQNELETRFDVKITQEDARLLARRLSGVPVRVENIHVIRPDLMGHVLEESARDGDVAGLIPKLFGVGKRADVETRYRGEFVALLRELRIFAGTNTLLFLLSLAAWGSAHARHDLLRAPTLALVGSTGVSLVIYVSSRSLLWTLLGSSYLGHGYLVWVAALFAVFLDLLSNDARGLELLARLLWFAR